MLTVNLAMSFMRRNIQGRLDHHGGVGGQSMKPLKLPQEETSLVVLS